MGKEVKPFYTGLKHVKIKDFQPVISNELDSFGDFFDPFKLVQHENISA